MRRTTERQARRQQSSGLPPRCSRQRPAAAQGADPNPGAITSTADIDFVNAYMFRGIPQDESGVIMWPYGDLGFALFSGDGGLKSVGVNSARGTASTPGTRARQRVERQALVRVRLLRDARVRACGGGTSVGVTYTAYTSPNGLFGDREGNRVQVRRGRQRVVWAAAAVQVRTCCVARELDGPGRRRVRKKGRISSSASRRAIAGLAGQRCRFR